jgi:hypothetical protein
MLKGIIVLLALCAWICVWICAWIYLFIYDWRLAMAILIVMTVDNMLTIINNDE